MGTAATSATPTRHCGQEAGVHTRSRSQVLQGFPWLRTCVAIGAVRLHSLRYAVAYWCDYCLLPQESVLLATIEQAGSVTVACPDCSHWCLQREATGAPENRPATTRRVADAPAVTS